MEYSTLFIEIFIKIIYPKLVSHRVYIALYESQSVPIFDGPKKHLRNLIYSVTQGH